MSKNDYILLAQALKDSKPFSWESNNLIELGACDQWKQTVEMISMTLAQQNPRFNRDRFLHACGYKEG